MLDLSPTAEAVPEARSALDALSERISDQTLEDARLLVSELVTNSLRHAELSSRDTIGVSADIAQGVLRIEVRDRGRGFVPEPRTADSSEHSKWGLYLVERLADRWGVVSDGVTLVWFEIGADRPDSEELPTH